MDVKQLKSELEDIKYKRKPAEAIRDNIDELISKLNVIECYGMESGPYYHVTMSHEKFKMYCKFDEHYSQNIITHDTPEELSPTP
jgi:hypothetical protein